MSEVENTSEQTMENDEKSVESQNSSKNESIESVVNSYLASIRGIALTAQIALPHIAKWTVSEYEKRQEKIESFYNVAKEEGKDTLSFDNAREFAGFYGAVRELEDIKSCNYPAVMASSLFTQLFAEFDSYIGLLLKAIYIKNDILLKGISREISLSDLLDFEDINAVKMSMLEKEIDSFRRDSYVEQFSTLEKKFSLTLKKFKEWPEFVELSQRRNILTHNGGAVSDQYLTICEKEGYLFATKPRIGEPLKVTMEYFTNAARLLSKVGLMLAYTLWNKVFPKEIELIHESLNNTIYNCLRQKRWRFVADLEDFVFSANMKKDISDLNFRIRIINIAIGLKFSGQDKEAIGLIDSADWSASYRDFKLAIYVLKEKYKDAVKVMESIGKSGEIIRQPDYHTWPLFTQFREQPEFYAAYYEIYNEPFSETVITEKGSVEAHAKSPEISEGIEEGAFEVVGNEKKSKPTRKKVTEKKAPA